MQEITVGKKYKHYKGNVYEIIALAKHSETCEDMVVYQNVEKGDVWVRPKSMWNEPVVVNTGNMEACAEAGLAVQDNCGDIRAPRSGAGAPVLRCVALLGQESAALAVDHASGLCHRAGHTVVGSHHSGNTRAHHKDWRIP